MWNVTWTIIKKIKVSFIIHFYLSIYSFNLDTFSKDLAF